MGDTNFSSVYSGTVESTSLVKGVNFQRGSVTFDIVRGTSTASSSKAIAHGLTSVAAVFTAVRASTGTQANNVDHLTYRTSGGTTTFYGWKHTGAGTTTLKAATSVGTFDYLFLGTA